MIKMGAFILNVIAEWWKQSQVAKGTVTIAMGSSIGFVTMMGIFKEQIADVNASIDKKIEVSEVQTLQRMLDQKMYNDAQFRQIHEDYVYLRGAIDVTNQNVLSIVKDKRK